MAGKTTLTSKYINRLVGCFTLMLAFTSCNEKYTLQASLKIEQFPSGSGIEFKNDRIYVAGDDASYLLVVNEQFTAVDSISLYTSTEKRISKETKADLEALSFVFGHRDRLLALGSGSLPPFRDTLLDVDLSARKADRFSLKTFHQRLKRAGITEINLEGMATTPWGVILANRGNKANRRNHLVLTSTDFYEQQEDADIKLIPLTPATDTALPFTGISGICYSGMSDRLLVTASTEDTHSSYQDGAIGKSYLWIVEDISAKRRFVAMNPNHIIDLEKIDKRLKGQKIESVTIMQETNKTLTVALVADNDDGSTTLFKLLIRKK